MKQTDARLLDDMLNILRKGGVVVVDDPNNYLVVELCKRKLVQIVKDDKVMRLNLLPTERDFEGFVKEAERVKKEMDDKELDKKSKEAAIESAKYQKLKFIAYIICSIIVVFGTYASCSK